jgi:hypothetical protein
LGKGRRSLGDLTLTDATGKEFLIPRSEVGTIVAKVRDDLADGALSGAAVGSSVALTVLAIVGSQDGYVLPSAQWGSPLPLSGLGGLVFVLLSQREGTCVRVDMRPP